MGKDNLEKQSKRVHPQETKCRRKRSGVEVGCRNYSRETKVAAIKGFSAIVLKILISRQLYSYTTLEY